MIDSHCFENKIKLVERHHVNELSPGKLDFWKKIANAHAFMPPAKPQNHFTQVLFRKLLLSGYATLNVK